MSVIPSVPALTWISRYRRDWWAGDLTAGLTVGVMLIPQGMAYALLAGLPPIYGLYAATLPLLVYAVLGTSRQLAVGPVAMDSLLTATAVGALATVGTEDYLYLTVLLALMVGAMQLAAGLFRLGFLVDLLSRPIISGFTAAAALIIGLSQLQHLLGVNLGRSTYVHEILYAAAMHLTVIQPLTLFIGVGGILVLVGAKRWWPAVPGPLAVVVLGIGVVYLTGWDAAGIHIVREVPAGLPSLGMPLLDLTDMQALLPTALTIALIGFMEGIAVAKAVNARHPEYTVEPNQELVAIGASNIGSALVGGFPVAGGFSRTAVNDQAGARTGLAAVISAGVIVLTLLFLTPLFYYLPQAVLAAIIVMAIFNLVDLHTPRWVWRYSKPDAISLAVTFVAVLIAGIEIGILAGIAVSILLLMWRTSRPHIAVVGRVGDTEHFRNVNRHQVRTCPQVFALRVDESLYFANARYLEDYLLGAVADRPAVRDVVLICSALNDIDASALESLEDLIHSLQGAGVTLHLAEVKGPVMDRLQRTEFLEHLKPGQVFLSTHQAMVALKCC